MKMVEYDIGIVIFIGIGNINLIYVFVIVLIFLDRIIWKVEGVINIRLKKINY